MENNYFAPAQIIENNLKGAVGKANLKLHKMIMMGFSQACLLQSVLRDQILQYIRLTILD